MTEKFSTFEVTREGSEGGLGEIDVSEKERRKYNRSDGSDMVSSTPSFHLGCPSDFPRDDDSPFST